MDCNVTDRVRRGGGGGGEKDINVIIIPWMQIPDTSYFVKGNCLCAQWTRFCRSAGNLTQIQFSQIFHGASCFFFKSRRSFKSKFGNINCYYPEAMPWLTFFSECSNWQIIIDGFPDVSISIFIPCLLLTGNDKQQLSDWHEGGELDKEGARGGEQL